MTVAFNGRYSIHNKIKAPESLLDKTHANVQLTEIDGRSQARIREFTRMARQNEESHGAKKDYNSYLEDCGIYRAGLQ